MDSPFWKTFIHSFSHLKDLAIKNKYRILIPQKRFVSEPMFNLNFYNNHIYRQCPYDDSKYINLNGKVLELKNGSKFVSFLGWKKQNLEFNIKDQASTTDGIMLLSIDNVCDESSYSEPSNISKDNQQSSTIRRLERREEYIQQKNNWEQSLNKEEFKKAMTSLEAFTDALRYKYIFLKGHEMYYSGYFIRDIRDVIEAFQKAFYNKIKLDDNTIQSIICEFVDSLIFDKLYDYLFGNLKVFYAEEELEFKTKLKELPNKFEFTGVNECFKGCKFEEAIKLLNTMKDLKSFFEKNALLSKINDEINKEAKEVYESNSKKAYEPQGDTLIFLWSHLITKSQLPDIYAHFKFLNLFPVSQSEFGAAGYLHTTFVAAFETVFKEYMATDQIVVNQNIPKYKVDVDKKK
jgi:hypothetical protein